MHTGNIRVYHAVLVWNAVTCSIYAPVVRLAAFSFETVCYCFQTGYCIIQRSGRLVGREINLVSNWTTVNDAASKVTSTCQQTSPRLHCDRNHRIHQLSKPNSKDVEDHSTSFAHTFAFHPVQW